MIESDKPNTIRRAGHQYADSGVVGLAYALGAFLIWGLSPIYFKALGQLPTLEIVAHRVVWSFVLVGALLLVLRRPKGIAGAIGGRGRLPLYALTTLLVSGNWFLFIWAVNNSYIVQASLGYYINPLVNVLLGMVFLGERLSRRQRLAVLIASGGVLYLAISLGEPPWIALTLAFSFGFYALLRKKADIDPLAGFAVEAGLVTPFCLAYLAGLAASGTGNFGVFGAGYDLLIILSGAVTATPMILFMYGARRLNLSTLGLMQYLTPTCHLLLAVLVYGEGFTAAHLVTFGCIWTALVLYSSDAIRNRTPARLPERTAVAE